MHLQPKILRHVVLQILCIHYLHQIFRLHVVLCILFLLPILMICSSGISVMMSYTLVDNPRLHFISPAVKIVLDVAPFVLTWMSFTGMYLAFPNTKVRFKNAFLSGVFAGTAFQILQYLFLSGQIYVSKYNAIYGSFAFLPLLLI